MALGGGTWVTQNEVLPGAYINFVSAARSGDLLSERGVAAMPIVFPWGPEDEVFTVSEREFRRYSLSVFGFETDAPQMRMLRELFCGIRSAHLYRVNQGGARAACQWAAARHTGTRGNDITLTIAHNEDSTPEDTRFDVTTYLAGVRVDVQKGVADMAGLADNDYVTWNREQVLEPCAGMPLEGGTDGTVSDANYQTFLDRMESYSFHALGLSSNKTVLKALFAGFTRRMRETVGMKFQCVLYRYPEADYEGVVSVENKLKGERGDEQDSASLVYWATGKQAACPVEGSLTNAVYDGEYTPDAQYTQLQLERMLEGGRFVLHKVNDAMRVLEDINTLTTFTAARSADFASNQTIRVVDQIGNDIAALFASRYLGVMPNDNAGRMSLWSDIVTHHQSLEKLRAIEDFVPEQIRVERGESKKSVVVTDCITPVNAMTQLYMTVVVQ